MLTTKRLDSCTSTLVLWLTTSFTTHTSPPPPPFPCRHGAVDLDEEERKKEQERSAAFQGSGFRLGDSEGPSTVVTGAQRAPKQAEKVSVVCAGGVE